MDQERLQILMEEDKEARETLFRSYYRKGELVKALPWVASHIGHDTYVLADEAEGLLHKIVEEVGGGFSVSEYYYPWDRPRIHITGLCHNRPSYKVSSEEAYLILGCNLLCKFCAKKLKKKFPIPKISSISWAPTWDGRARRETPFRGRF